MMRRALLAALLCCGVTHAQPLDAAGAARLRQAAGQDPEAAYDLGRMVRNGIGVAREPLRAFALIESSALRGHAPAMFTLSAMLAAGEGCTADLAAARRWLEAAAELEHPEALQQMAMYVQEGALGYPRDTRRAAQLLREAAHAMTHRAQEHQDQRLPASR
ncbi:sel1 repeat family protein [Massilia sp. P8910]|uniref:tetratricopeptide repeat protein n=1 Tax=Massilia antarctica TaxID=2765360 RepID=UPI001E639B88|nr:tetratricopeptide repeat protein [Massilia antarctica]MCE3606349.1 sel1 repeat family protein [Massilia antarctica]